MRIRVAELGICLSFLSMEATASSQDRHVLIRGGGSIRARPKVLNLKRGRVARFRLAFVAFWKSLFDPFYGLDSKILPGTAGQGIIYEPSGGGSGRKQPSSFASSKVKGLTVTTLASSSGCSSGG
jgi:hypothetical protein